MPDHAPAPARRRIALIAHDNKKRDMLEWAEYNIDLLAGHELFATATTGHLLEEQLGLPVTCFPHRRRRDRSAGVLVGSAGAASA
jgi:methylglyoxal synthase